MKQFPSRIAIFSDAHGVYPALEAAWRDAQPYQPTLVIYAGDFTRGPFPNEVIDFLRSVDARMILGNDDITLLRIYNRQVPQTWLEAKQYGIARWTLNQLSTDNLRFLQSLPARLSIPIHDRENIFIVHGSPYGASDSINPEYRPDHFTKIINTIDETILICGHSHRQWQRRQNGKLALNPGADAGTRIGPLAQYALLEWDGGEWHVSHHCVPYDIQAVRQAFTTRGLLEEGGSLARGYLLSLETDFDYMMAFLQYVTGRAKEAGISDFPIPDDIWDQAGSSFDWEQDHRTT